jgi:hypothetical protein
MQVYVQPPGIDWLRFYRASTMGLHDSSSHEIDGPKYLKYDQIVSVHDTALVLQVSPALVPHVSGAQVLVT